MSEDPARPDPLAAQSNGDPEQPTHLGKTDREEEAEHLRRVATELGSANARSVASLIDDLNHPDRETRMSVAAALGALGDRQAIALLRGLLSGDEPESWETAVNGLRNSRDRSGWLCLESVALDLLPTLAGHGKEPVHAFRLLVMGRTKTMDRLFRAIDGHSRSISGDIALRFARVAVSSVPADMALVMAMRLGISGERPSPPLTPEQVSAEAGVNLDRVRYLESTAWEIVQAPRRYSDIRAHFDRNRLRFQVG